MDTCRLDSSTASLQPCEPNDCMFDRHFSQDDLFHFYFILDLSSSGISLQVLNSILRLNAEAHGVFIVFFGFFLGGGGNLLSRSV